MTLKTVLYERLTSDEEPLAKRLKLADNVFKSPEIPVKSREIFLLKWLLDTQDTRNQQVWQQCHGWLNTNTFKQLHASEMSNEDIENILKCVAQEFASNDREISLVLMQVMSSLLESPIFQLYFRNNPLIYAQYIKTLLKCISNSEITYKFLKNERLVGKKCVVIDEFRDIFTENLLSSLVGACARFEHEQNGAQIFAAASAIVQKILFLKREKNFEEDLESNATSLLPAEPNYAHYKLIFHAFITQNRDSSVICKFLAYLLGNFGFSLENYTKIGSLTMEVNTNCDIETALAILQSILEVVHLENVTVKFQGECADFYQHLLLAMIQNTAFPINATCYEIIELIIRISPLSIEPNISQLLVYLMTSSTPHVDLYGNVLCSIFDVFNKLHRVQNLMSKMIRALQPVYFDNSIANETKCDSLIIFKGAKSIDSRWELQLEVDKLLPTCVLHKFASCLLTFAHGQLSTLFKTFVFHLHELVGGDLQTASCAQVTFIEFVARLLVHYLTTMNVNFRVANVIDKFTKVMHDEEAMLATFGNALVGIEHNLNLMRVFLHLAYTWGELKLLFEHAVNKTSPLDVLPLGLGQETSASCDIAVLHSYLPSQTWCLIAERITNFGKKPCKEIMEKLWLQKIRALTLAGLDDSALGEHVGALMKRLTPLEDYYAYLLTDQFASKAILQHLDADSLIKIADCALKKRTLTRFPLENRSFLVAFVYCLFKKINKLFKKHPEAVSTEMLQLIGLNLIAPDEFDYEPVRETISHGIHAVSGSKTLKYEQLTDLLQVFQALPIVFLPTANLTSIFYYLLGVFVDLRHSTEDGAASLLQIEHLLLGICKTNQVVFSQLLSIDDCLELVSNDFACYEQWLELLITQKPNIIKEIVHKLSNRTVFKSANEKELHIWLIIFKQHKISDYLTLEPQTNICNAILAMKRPQSLHLQVLATICTPSIDNKAEFEQFAAIIQNILNENRAEMLNTGELCVLQSVLQHFDAIATHLSPDFLEKSVHLLLKTSPKDDSIAVYANTVVLLSNKMNVVELPIFLDAILQQTLDTQILKLNIQIWEQLVSSTGNKTNNLILQQRIEELTLKLYQNCIKDDQDETISPILMQLQVHLIQNTQQLMTSTSLDLCFTTLVHRMTRFNSNSNGVDFTECINALEMMLKHRQALICDRLPVFLQCYRSLLNAVCTQSDTSLQKADAHYERMADLAHLLEKLTISMCKLQSHIASLAAYLIADILRQYEMIALYPAVKVALDKCINNLLALCSGHEIACLLRVLSPGATALFKALYDAYKRYHRFTGKV